MESTRQPGTKRVDFFDHLFSIEKDLKRASLPLYGITTERSRVRLKELVGDRERWKNITAASMAGRLFSSTNTLEPDPKNQTIEH